MKSLYNIYKVEQTPSSKDCVYCRYYFLKHRNGKTWWKEENSAICGNGKDLRNAERTIRNRITKDCLKLAVENEWYIGVCPLYPRKTYSAIFVSRKK